MRTSRNGAKPVVILCIMAVALLAALGAAASEARGAVGRRPLLLAEPLTKDAAGTDIWAVEDFRKDSSVFATYEIRKQASVNAVKKSHRVNIIGTNSVYLDVMGYPALNGGFITKESFDAGSKLAVLNERAAFDMFGGGKLYGSIFQMNNETWTVIGVIRDESENAGNIYIPASSDFISSGANGAAGGGAYADSLMALLGGGGSGAYASIMINVLKDIGISENTHSFLQLGKAAESFDEMAFVALRIALCAFLILLARLSLGAATRSLKSAASENDLAAAAVMRVEPKSSSRFAIFRIIVSLLFFFAFIAAILYFGKQIVEVCITWQEIPILFKFSKTAGGAFEGRLDTLGGWQAAVACLFAASATASIAALLAAARMISE